MKSYLVKQSANRLTGSLVGSSSTFSLSGAVDSYSGLYSAPDASQLSRYVSVGSVDPASPLGINVGSSDNAGAYCSLSFFSKTGGVAAHLSTVGGGRIADLLLTTDGKGYCQPFSGNSASVDIDQVRGWYRIGVAVMSAQLTALIFPTSATNVASIGCSSGAEVFLWGFQTVPSSHPLLPYRADLSSASPDFVRLSVTAHSRNDAEQAFRMRSSTGRGYSVKTGVTKALRIAAEHLSRADRSSVCSWWSGQDALSLHFADETTIAASGSGIVTFSGRITNQDHPAARTMKPYLDQFSASIILESF